MSKHLFITTSLLFFLVVEGRMAIAEPQGGRLPDGRAYRTDSEGAQLVDYIAELEQNASEQNRKIISLEDENSTLKLEIERVKAGHSDQVQERNLIGDAKQPASKFSEQAVFKSHEPELVVDKKRNCPEAMDCSEQVQAAQLKAIQENSKAENKSDLRTQVSQLEDELVKARADRDRFSAIIQQSTAKASQNEKDLTALRVERDRLKSKLQQVSVKNSNDMKASMSPDLDASRIEAVESLKARMKKEWQLLITRKDERDLLFAKYLQERQGLTLKPSSLRAKSGRELKQLEELITKAETVRELAAIRIDLEDIRHQLADDLALAERMSKLQ